MSFWAAFPFLRYVLWLIAGIVAGKISWFMDRDVCWVFTGILALSYVGCYFILNRFQSGLGVLACALLISIGFAREVEQRESLMPDYLPEGVTYWLLKTETEAVPTPATVKVQAAVLAHKDGNTWRETNGKVLLYIRKKDNNPLPPQGSLLIIRAELNPVPPPLNPEAFDYKSYLAMQGICCQAFVLPDQVQLAGSPEAEAVFFPKELAHKVQTWALEQVKKHVSGNQEAAIVNSLVLGYRETLDQELVQAYSTAGTMHVLAVSGLHVGVLYLFLKILFRGWRRSYRLKWISYLISLLVLWGYAFITGLSPSVMRAVLMFSVVEAALLKKRKTSIYNSVSIAAFILLVADPNMLWAVSFQLSFLAVLGIVYLQPKIAVWYKGENKVFRKGWDFLAASLAAQFATFSLALYYFGQFPTYFFISNLLIVPSAFFVLAAGFLLLLSSLLSTSLAAVAGGFLYYLVKAINWVVFTVEALPYSRLTMHLTEPQLWLLLLVLALLLLLFQFRRIEFAALFSLATICLLASFTYGAFQEKNQKKLIIYHIPGYSLLQLVEGREEFFVADDELPPSQLQYQVQPYRKVLGVLKTGKEDILEKNFQPAILRNESYSLMVWRGLSVVKVERELSEPCREEKPMEVNFVLLTHNSVKDLKSLSCLFRGDTIVIDGSNSSFLQKELVEQAESFNLPYYLTAEAGAFELNL